MGGKQTCGIPDAWASAAAAYRCHASLPNWLIYFLFGDSGRRVEKKSMCQCPICDADHKNLNQEASQRLRTWTEGWVEGLDLGTLWEDYGIVGDIMPFTNDFPRADIHKMISEARANAILDQVDRRIVALPSFPG
ncbi:hypothetical protein QCA50_019127 [Cerrena zonata]|uniref:Uncharacterized protein n=1 Tax=Cerrena zonata TaxID=2478898 RepID=A0AAW0FL30_9APHY